MPCADGDASFAGTVEMVEQLGADSLLHVAHGAERRSSRACRTASIRRSARRCTSRADPEHVFLFDAESGRIR